MYTPKFKEAAMRLAALSGIFKNALLTEQQEAEIKEELRMLPAMRALELCTIARNYLITAKMKVLQSPQLALVGFTAIYGADAGVEKDGFQTQAGITYALTMLNSKIDAIVRNDKEVIEKFIGIDGIDLEKFFHSEVNTYKEYVFMTIPNKRSLPCGAYIHSVYDVIGSNLMFTSTNSMLRVMLLAGLIKSPDDMMISLLERAGQDKKIILFVDADNSCFTKVANTLEVVMERSNIQEVRIYTDDKTSPLWNILQHRDKIKIIKVPRVLREKSLVDQTIIMDTAIMLSENADCNALLLSNDSDYAPLLNNERISDRMILLYGAGDIGPGYMAWLTANEAEMVPFKSDMSTKKAAGVSKSYGISLAEKALRECDMSGVKSRAAITKGLTPFEIGLLDIEVVLRTISERVSGYNIQIHNGVMMMTRKGEELACN